MKREWTKYDATLEARAYEYAIRVALLDGDAVDEEVAHDDFEVVVHVHVAEAIHRADGHAAEVVAMLHGRRGAGGKQGAEQRCNTDGSHDEGIS